MTLYSHRYAPIVILLLGLTAGCGGSSSDQNGSPLTTTLSTTQTQDQQGALQLTLQAPQVTYNAGQDIPLTLTMKNNGSQNVNGALSCVGYDLQVTQGSTIIYDSNSSGAQPACARILDLTPGQSQTLSPDWNQTKTDGKSISRGTYTLTVYLDASGIGISGPIAPPPITLTVK